MRDRYIQDTRIHCCLYFINPTGHALRPIDVIVMKKLSEVVNVVPVIAKSDSLTLEERERFKLKVYYLFVPVFYSYFFPLYRSEKSWFSTALIHTLLTQTRTMKKKFILMKLLGWVLSGYHSYLFIESLFGRLSSHSLWWARRTTWS